MLCPPLPAPSLKIVLPLLRRTIEEILPLTQMVVMARAMLPIQRLAARMVMPTQQPNLFGNDEQDDLFGPESAPSYRPDPDKVRRRLEKILAEARAAQKLPWEPTTVSLYRNIFPQMTNWLPEEEGAQLRFEFETELARLEAA